jgi:hypothetical protein
LHVLPLWLVFYKSLAVRSLDCCEDHCGDAEWAGEGRELGAATIMEWLITWVRRWGGNTVTLGAVFGRDKEAVDFGVSCFPWQCLTLIIPRPHQSPTRGRSRSRDEILAGN